MQPQSDIHKKYLSILNHFTDPERNWMSALFTAGKWLGATDAHTCALVENWGLEAPDQMENLKVLLPFEYEMKKKFSVADLAKRTDSIPFKIAEIEDFKCGACDGDGEVEFEFNFGSKNYTTKDTCPICNGTGEDKTNRKLKRGDRIYPSSHAIQIEKSILKARDVDLLINIARKLEESEITLIKQGFINNKNYFKIGEFIIIILPIQIGHEEYTIV